MKPYQEEYLALLRSVTEFSGSLADRRDPESFSKAAWEANHAARAAVERGTQLLREGLFPVLDNILGAPEEEVRSIEAFAGKLMTGYDMQDVGLHYRIHLALLEWARRRADRDMIIKELYLVGLSLFSMEAMLNPSPVRLYVTRMRMCFAEGASYYDTEYDDITNPETRGYIHRCMGNIPLSYQVVDPATVQAKLNAVKRSIQVLSDPEVRAKTPSLPWDTYLFRSHQECTTLLGNLREGNVGPEAYALVLESAQIVQETQLRAARERGEPLNPRWQYAYMAARYHCGAMLLPEFLEGLYSLSTTRDDSDSDGYSFFTHASAPAYFLEYSKTLTGDSRYAEEIALRARRMTQRFFRWLIRISLDGQSDSAVMSIRQFVLVYREKDCGLPYYDMIQNVFAAIHPATYARMWIAGQIAREMTLWAADECPEQLVGLPGCESVKDVVWRDRELADLAERAGRVYDLGMIYFFNLENAACRGLFEEEEALLQLHAFLGGQLLGRHGSTAALADVARGHHRSYDEKGGYPADFSVRESPMRPIICIVAAADVLAGTAGDTFSRYRPIIPFDAACAQILEGSGSRYAPFVADLLRSPVRRAQLAEKLDSWKKEAYLDMYQRRARMLEM